MLRPSRTVALLFAVLSGDSIRTGSSFSNGSGDYFIAFSTAAGGIRTPERRAEEAIYNSLFMATTTRSHDGVQNKDVVIERLPLARFLKGRKQACR